jgi:putative redox protein
METFNTTYLGEYRTEATHVRSSSKLITDAPVDNNGKGEAFSPTDLVATALTSCMLTIMDMTATAHGFSLRHATVKTSKIMASNPRRISEIDIEFDMSSANYSDRERKILQKAAEHCPVAHSIHPDIKVNIVYKFSE